MTYISKLAIVLYENKGVCLRSFKKSYIEYKRIDDLLLVITY